MEKNGLIFRSNTWNLGRTHDNRSVGLRAVDGKLRLDLDKQGVYASYTPHVQRKVGSTDCHNGYKSLAFFICGARVGLEFN